MAAETLLTEEQIHHKTATCARDIAAAYADAGLSETNPLILINVLKGSILFTADLMRHLMDRGVPCVMECMWCASYHGGLASCGTIQLLLDIQRDIRKRHVLIVEDIVDSARTLTFLIARLRERGAASVKTVVLLDKPSGRKVPYQPDFTIATIPNKFVIGYGLDWEDQYRGIRDVIVMKRSFYEASLRRKAVAAAAAKKEEEEQEKVRRKTGGQDVPPSTTTTTTTNHTIMMVPGEETSFWPAQQEKKRKRLLQSSKL